MAGRRGFKAYPRHLGRAKGVGTRECQATGFLRSADEAFVEDVRQGNVSRDFADITPGFGTRHPRDFFHPHTGSDPSPIPNAEPKDNRNLSKSDLLISDEEIRLSIVEGRPPRQGF
jgi:hypothetical protein